MHICGIDLTNLSNHNTLKRHIKPALIPPDHRATREALANMIRYGRVYARTETFLHRELIV